MEAPVERAVVIHLDQSFGWCCRNTNGSFRIYYQNSENPPSVRLGSSDKVDNRDKAPLGSDSC